MVSTHGGIQTPSEVFSALINDDNNDAGMSWVGTNSDGTQTAGNTIEEWRPSPAVVRLQLHHRLPSR